MRSDLNGGGRNGKKLINSPFPGELKCSVPHTREHNCLDNDFSASGPMLPSHCGTGVQRHCSTLKKEGEVRLAVVDTGSAHKTCPHTDLLPFPLRLLPSQKFRRGAVQRGLRGPDRLDCVPILAPLLAVLTMLLSNLYDMRVISKP